jgi:hypothetical protein
MRNPHINVYVHVYVLLYAMRAMADLPICVDWLTIVELFGQRNRKLTPSGMHTNMEEGIVVCLIYLYMSMSMSMSMDEMVGLTKLLSVAA